MPPSSHRKAVGQGLLALVLALLGLALPPPAVAATREFYFQSLGSGHGLVQNTVTSLAQDRQGFVWVGTQGGLHRFDGQRFVPYRHDPQNPASIPDSYITALALDRERGLWIGTRSRYVARLDLGNGTVRRYLANPSPSGPRHHVLALAAQGDRLWVASVDGLEWLEPESGQRHPVVALQPTADRDTAPQNLLTDAHGTLWYGNRTGLFRINPDAQATRVGPAVSVTSLSLDRQGQLWVGRGDGLYRLHSNGRDVLRVWPDGSAPAAGDVRSIIEAPDRHLWFSVGSEGLRRFDPQTGTVSVIEENASVPASLPEDAITALMVDRSGMLWVGGQFRGAAITDPRGSRFTYVLELDGTRKGSAAADDSIRSVLETEPGVLWLGTDDGRLLRYETADDRFTDWTPRLPTPLASTKRRVMAMGNAGHGRLWLATTHGLLRLDTGSGSAETIPLGAFGQPSLRSLLLARDGDLWLGSLKMGVFRYRRDGSGVSQYAWREGDPRSLSHPTANALLEDGEGRMWIGTNGGLDVLNPATGQLRHLRHHDHAPGSLAGNVVRSLSQTADGTVWVGTHSGLSRATEAADGSIHFSQPLSGKLATSTTPAIYSISQSGGRELWLGTDIGMLRLDPGNGSVRTYGVADGLQDLEFNGGAATRLRDGRLAFGGVRGLNLFDPARIVDSSFSPPVRLLAARIGLDASGDSGALWLPSQLDIPAGADLLRLRIGAFDFHPAARIRYRYRLEGFDRGWVDNGTSPDITYTRLPPGGYTLRAQATNRDGIWSPDELQVPVHVAPPLWRHPLAIFAAVLVVLGAIAAAAWHWNRRRRIEQNYFGQIREREERLKLALWASGEQFWDYDLAHGQVHRMRVDDPTGGPGGGEIRTQITTDHVIHGDDLPQVLDQLRQHLHGDSALFLSEHRTRAPDGSWQWVRARGRVVERGPDGRALRVAGTARDITASRSAERERRIASEVLRSMAEAVAVFDRDFNFVSVNPAFSRMTGYSDAEVIGRDTALLDSLQHDPDFYQHMRVEMERTGRWSGEVWQRRKDGTEFLCWLQASIVHDASGQRGHYVAVLGDITDQKRAEQELRYLANYDTLTGLPNRTLLSERLSRAIVRARRQNHRIAVLFLDLDRFKDINDSLGHAAGDRILRAAAARLQQTVGAQHTVARLGGDEFNVVLENIDNAEQAEQVALEIIAAFERPLDLEERHEVVISPSIGISLYPDHAQVPTDLLKHADTAMYQAKAIGRRTFMRYTESMDHEIRQRATISTALRKVLDRGELRLVFQPRMALADRRITGVEALLRWTSAEHGEIAPIQFVPLAEETGLIMEIGEWALREACTILKRWQDQGLDDLTMAVNVSALQLLRGDLPTVVSRTLETTGIDARGLELELTESVIMENAEQTASTLQAFRELGIALAVDDFGTGYSSLAYLKRLPINTLKIDKAFIADLTIDPDDEAITTTVIAMAHSLGLNVIAEGVETEAQMHFLRTHECDEIQGYWLARPMEEPECLAFILDWGRPRHVTAVT
ncbi:EAL domain-containing protein [Aerolutibacter ruishenii]|uniref:cyclic-guanylate-specific phosphodiesterase n=1 Tax=Aerolutibacter ruishenii TaxID=686800 RepID=A0A562LK03_9GAMM|nr:EAL domain-containing protein [Lysobacter ruishenii]TWI07916.1 PAS domain S-box-containing protein/diguanylate cyclase (GGDEF)-like protein [Lysobacter ruishenii]